MVPNPILHPIPPVFDADSRILILGSFPSVRSREEGFFYGHPRNRFWAVLSRLLEEPLPATVEEKKAFLLRSRIALTITAFGTATTRRIRRKRPGSDA